MPSSLDNPFRKHTTPSNPEEELKSVRALLGEEAAQAYLKLKGSTKPQKSESTALTEEEKRILSEREEETKQKESNELIEFRGFHLPRKEVEFIQYLEAQTGELSLGDSNSSARIKIEDNHIEALNLRYTSLTSLTQPLPESLRYLDLFNAPLTSLTQPLPESLEELDLSFTYLAALTQPLPESLKVLRLFDTGLTALTQPLPSPLKELNLRRTPLATDPAYAAALEDLKQKAQAIEGLKLII